MKVFIKIIFYIVCMIICFIIINNSYKPNYAKYDKYIKLLNSCSSTQNAIESAILKYGNNTMFLSVRNDDEFAKMEKELIKSNCLDKDYNKASSDCFFVIIYVNVYCGCHSDVIQIEENIKWINELISHNKFDEYLDYIFALICGICVLGGLFC